ncbi:DNA-binding protein, partial [Halobacteriales archaeon QH_10_67_13]
IDMPFDDYVIKPVSRADLIETVERLLTTSEYEDQLRRYYALTAKHATLLANKPESELADNDEFQELEAEMNRLRGDLEETITDFTDEEFAAAFRDLDADLPDANPDR